MNIFYQIAKYLVMLTLVVPCTIAQAAEFSLFSAVEQQWIAQHPSVRVRISRTDPPFEFYKDDRYQGIAYDYLQIISEKTGIQFDLVEDLSWPETLDGIRERSVVDMIPLVSRADVFREYVSFSYDYADYEWVIISKESQTEILDFSSLSGKTVVVKRVFVDIENLRRDISGVNLLEVESTDEALKLVSKGKADAYVGNLASGSWSIEQKGFTNLKVVGSTPYGKAPMAMGIREDWPELTHIIDTVLHAIPDNMHQQIRNRWLPINYDDKVTSSNVLLWIMGVIIVSLFLIIQLRLTVRRRTSAIQSEVALRTEKEVELQMSMEHLKRTHKRLRFNIDRMPLGYIVWDEKFSVSEWNPAAERIFGWTADEARGKHAYELVVPEEAKTVVDQVWADLMRGDETSTSVNENISKNGHHLICSWYNTPLRDTEGAVSGALSMVEDITQRYQEEESRKQQFELVSKIFDSINALVYVADLETFELLYLNQFGQDNFGESWVGRKCYEYLQEGQTQICPFCTNDKLMINGEAAPAYIWEFQNTVNQRWYQCVDRAIPWFDGKFVRMEIAFDITEAKLTEQLKEEMISAVSHEMRTPLTAVLGYVEFLMTNQVEPAELQEHVQTIYTEAEKLNDLINSFLNLQHLKAGQQPLNLFAVDVCSVLQNIRVDLSREGTLVELEVNCPDKLASVKGDAIQVREAVYRVVTNAIKFSPSGGRVVMSAEQSGNMIDISIADQGVGIPAAALAKIFDRFYRVDNTDTREFGGVGIGLSLVHDLVMAHGGQVRAESEEGQGTTITLSFSGF